MPVETILLLVEEKEVKGGRNISGQHETMKDTGARVKMSVHYALVILHVVALLLLLSHLDACSLQLHGILLCLNNNY